MEVVTLFFVVDEQQVFECSLSNHSWDSGRDIRLFEITIQKRKSL